MALPQATTPEMKLKSRECTVHVHLVRPFVLRMLQVVNNNHDGPSGTLHVGFGINRCRYTSQCLANSVPGWGNQWGSLSTDGGSEILYGG
jgi:hypothetical protein